MVARGGGSVLTLTFLGSDRVFPNYNVMGVAKAALESSVRYLAADLGPENIRVNAISAGPVKTLAAAGIGGFSTILGVVREKAPLRRAIETSEVGDAAAFLLSDAGRGVTGEVMMVRRRLSRAGNVRRPESPCPVTAESPAPLRASGILNLDLRAVEFRVHGRPGRDAWPERIASCASRTRSRPRHGKSASPASCRCSCQVEDSGGLDPHLELASPGTTARSRRTVRLVRDSRDQRVDAVAVRRRRHGRSPRCARC